MKSPSLPTILEYAPACDALISASLPDILHKQAWHIKSFQIRTLLMFPQMMAAACLVYRFAPGYRRLFSTMQKGYISCVYDPRDFDALARSLKEQTLTQSTWVDDYYRAFLKESNKLEHMTSEIFWNFDVQHPKELKKVFCDLLNTVVQTQSYAYLTEGLVQQGETNWVVETFKELDPLLSEKEIAMLLHPNVDSFIADFYLQLAKAETEEDYEKILQRFFWIKGSYNEMPLLTIDVLKNEKANSPFRTSIEDSENFSRRVQHHRNQDIEKMIHLIHVFAKMQDERKANVLRTNYALQKIIQKLTEWIPEWTEGELMQLTPFEIMALIDGEKISKQDLRRRFEHNVWIFTPHHYCISSDEKLHDKISVSIFASDTEQIQGHAASPGKARGRVKIILHEADFQKMQSGDILVTSMTRPEFLPIMKKAAAFVTNEGGITCHAAIVSREMHKPCIIGTRFATRVLHDNDFVEVDAEKGIVKKLN